MCGVWSEFVASQFRGRTLATTQINSGERLDRGQVLHPGICRVGSPQADLGESRRLVQAARSGASTASRRPTPTETSAVRQTDARGVKLPQVVGKDIGSTRRERAGVCSHCGRKPGLRLCRSRTPNLRHHLKVLQERLHAPARPNRLRNLPCLVDATTGTHNRVD